MAGLTRFQYVDKDHAGIVSDCIARIKETYGESRWNDFEEDSSGVMLLEAFAYVVDLLLFYLDHQANETYLPTATERQNMINIAKLVGYKVSAAQPASVDITFAVEEPHGYDVTIPAKTRIETSDGIVFETREVAVISAGERSVSVGAVEGETFEDVVGVSDGEPDQEFYLPRAGIIELVELDVGGHVWGLVDSIADALPKDMVFMADLDAWGRVRLIFGDGQNGRIPRRDDKITARYRVGGGIAGNVAPDTITIMRDIATDSNGERVPVTVTNPGWAAGGKDPESAASIKRWAPRFFEAQARCVTQGDYEAFAMAFRDPEAGAFAKARAFVRERTGEANVIRYYVLAYGNGKGNVAAPPQALKDALRAYIDKYKMLTDWIEIEDGRWREVDIRGTVRIANGVKASEALADIEAAVSALFDLDVREMGEPLRISDLYAAIDRATGVLHVELTTPTATVEAEKDELLILGTVALEVEHEGAGSDGKNI